jgi:hypothetical protein
MSERPPFVAGGEPTQPNTTPRIGRISQDQDDVRQWAFQARGQWGVPVRVFERTLSAGGVNTRLWVAVIWPKGSRAERPRTKGER